MNSHPQSGDVLGLSETELVSMVEVLDRSAPAPKFQSAEHLRWLARAPGTIGPLCATRRNSTPPRLDASEKRVGLLGHAVGTPRRTASDRPTALLSHAFPLPPTEETRAAIASIVEQARSQSFDRVYALAARTDAPMFDAALGWIRASRLATRIAFPRPRQSEKFQHARVNPEFLESEIFRELIASIDCTPIGARDFVWDPETITWRLAAPYGRYLLSWSDNLVMVSIRRTGVVPMGLILKCWTRNSGSARARRRISSSGLMGAIARFHGTPLVGYRGHNAQVRVAGMRVATSAPFGLAVLRMRT